MGNIYGKYCLFLFFYPRLFSNCFNSTGANSELCMIFISLTFLETFLLLGLLKSFEVLKGLPYLGTKLDEQ